MRNDRTTNFLLFVIALALVALALRPYVVPAIAKADTSSAYPLHIEPGVQMLRAPDGTSQVYGMVMVDMRDGKIWGFPTLTTSVYPVEVGSSKPPVSHPFLLGTFAFSDTGK